MPIITPPSATVAINSLAAQKISMGEHIYNFAAGDPDLPLHPIIIEATIRAIEKGRCPYAPVAGLLELKQAASAWMNRLHQGRFKPENTLITCGGKFALYAALQALLSNGDEVLIPAPYWVSYPDMVKLSGGIPKIVPSSEKSHWKVSAEDLEGHITEKTKVLIFNNACNPTGALYTKEEILVILQVVKKHNLMIIADEVYSDLVFDGKFVSCSSFKEVEDLVIIIQSCSKNVAMAGFRVGFAFGPKAIIDKMCALQSQTTTGTSLLSQWAALAAIENYDEINAYVKKEMKKRRDLFIENFNQHFTPISAPASALYVFVPMISLVFDSNDSVTFCQKALQENNVAIVPGVAFGMEGYVRFAFSPKEKDIIEGLRALAKT